MTKLNETANYLIEQGVDRDIAYTRAVSYLGKAQVDQKTAALHLFAKVCIMAERDYVSMPVLDYLSEDHLILVDFIYNSLQGYYKRLGMGRRFSNILKDRGLYITKKLSLPAKSIEVCNRLEIENQVGLRSSNLLVLCGEKNGKAGRPLKSDTRVYPIG